MAIVLASLSACMADSREQILDVDKSPAELRSLQTRVFETSDTDAAFHAVLATVQDMGFGVDKADEPVGLVSATNMRDDGVHITVTIRVRGPSRLEIRASGERGLKAISDALPYQQFFGLLESHIALKAYAAG